MSERNKAIFLDGPHHGKERLILDRPHTIEHEEGTYHLVERTPNGWLIYEAELKE